MRYDFSTESKKPSLEDVAKFAAATLALAGDADAPASVIDNLLDVLRELPLTTGAQ